MLPILVRTCLFSICWTRSTTYYLPIYVFSGDHLLCARLRTSDRGPAHGVVAELERIVRRLREAWPQVRIMIRGNGGFSNDELMVWCEEEGVDYVLGLARNERLKRRIETRMEVVRQLHRETGKPVRQFQELCYQTLETCRASAGWWRRWSTCPGERTRATS